MANVRKLGAAGGVGTGLAAILDIDVENFTEGGFDVSNAGGTAFNAFEVRVLKHPSGPEVTIATIAGDFSTPLFPLRRTVGAPVTLAGGATAAIWMSLDGIKRLRFYASVAAGTTTANVHGQMK